MKKSLSIQEIWLAPEFLQQSGTLLRDGQQPHLAGANDVEAAQVGTAGGEGGKEHVFLAEAPIRGEVGMKVHEENMVAEENSGITSDPGPVDGRRAVLETEERFAIPGFGLCDSVCRLRFSVRCDEDDRTARDDGILVVMDMCVEFVMKMIRVHDDGGDIVLLLLDRLMMA
ncbi:hypothetical protein V8G54_023927 [Vigna mungo]|uniref:Uncharacterized protein n=1 Tax=Vigna mungo TaxID=3915 RepID=A0AAQ3RT04_VIGMU